MTNKIGHTYYSGNTLNPRAEVLVQVGIPACDVPPKEIRAWSLAYSGVPPTEFVRVSDAINGADRFIPTTVWDGTRHESIDAMIRSYVAKQGPSTATPGGILPGGR